MSILSYSLFSVVFLGLPGLRFCGTGTVVCSVVAGVSVFFGLPGLRFGESSATIGAASTVGSTTFFGLPGLRFGCSVFIFFGRPGLRLGLVSAVLSFFGRPGLRFGVWSDAAPIDPFKESGVWVVEVELVIVELVIVGVVPSTFNFLGLPRLGFSGTASGSGSGIGATFRLPLFTNVKSGLTW